VSAGGHDRRDPVPVDLSGGPVPALLVPESVLGSVVAVVGLAPAHHEPQRPVLIRHTRRFPPEPIATRHTERSQRSGDAELIHVQSDEREGPLKLSVQQ